MQQLQEHASSAQYRRGAASSYFSSPNQTALARAAGKQKEVRRSVCMYGSCACMYACMYGGFF